MDGRNTARYGGRRRDATTVRARLAELAARSAAEPTRAEIAEVLRERARQLAAKPEEARGGALAEVAVFRLAGETYALETSRIYGIVRTTMPTPVLSSPPHLAGIANIRGEILPVFDIRSFLHSGQVGLSDLSRLVLVGDERAELALLVDAVLSVAEIDRDELLDPPSPASAEARGLIAGVTPDGVILLDVVALLEDDRLRVDDT